MDSKKNKGKRKESVDRTSFYKPIGLYLKAVRESECISVEQMHEILQTPETHINKYERGEVKVPLHVFVKYCEVGKISPSELLNWNLSINSLNFPLFSRLPAIENSIYVSFSLVFALMG